MREIICGSKKYENICLDKLVDSFELITRHNMLLPDMGYGKRDANFQICNGHVIVHYHNKTKPKELYEDYIGKKISFDHLVSVHEFFKDSKAEFLAYPENNLPLMNDAIEKFKLNHQFSSNSFIMKVGLAHVAQCIKNEIKPFLIGYSLNVKSLAKHEYTNHKDLYNGHDHKGEIELLKKLHSAGLVDATLCLIKDEAVVSLSDEIEPTEEGLRIINDNLC